MIIYPAILNQYEIVKLDKIDSTRLEAIRIAKTKPKKKYIIIANRQEFGRGKNKKIWQSIEGNLHLNILLQDFVSISYLTQLSFVISVAIEKTISSMSFNTHNLIQFKWPNDILINQKKVSGNILETFKIHGRQYISIGIGINIFNKPNVADQPVTSLKAENFLLLKRNDFLSLLIMNFEKYLVLWKQTGFKKIQTYWSDKAIGINKQITLKTETTKVNGKFLGIDNNGAMQLKFNSGEIITITV